MKSVKYTTEKHKSSNTKNRTHNPQPSTQTRNHKQHKK